MWKNIVPTFNVMVHQIFYTFFLLFNFPFHSTASSFNVHFSQINYNKNFQKKSIDVRVNYQLNGKRPYKWWGRASFIICLILLTWNKNRKERKNGSCSVTLRGNGGCVSKCDSCSSTHKPEIYFKKSIKYGMDQLH